MIKLVRILPTLLLGLLTGCGDITPGRTDSEPAPIKGLGVMTLGSEALPASQMFVGTVESLDRGVIAARIDGRVGTIAVRAGDRVAAGALLLTIADTPAGAHLSEVESAREAANARQQLAEQTLERYRRLRAGEAVTPLEFDRVASEAEQARSALQAADAAVRQARTTAGYTRVTAPFAGRIVRRDVEVGSTVLPGTPLLVIDRSGGWQMRFDCPETLAGQIVAGSTLEVEIPSLHSTFPATVVEIQPAADPASRSFRAKASLPDDPRLAAGLFARAAHAAAASDTLLLPAAAVVTRGQLTGVFVVEENRLHLRMIRTGRTLGDRVEVLAGLSAGEAVVVNGTERAVSGARVEN